MLAPSPANHGHVLGNLGVCLVDETASQRLAAGITEVFQLHPGV